MRKHWIKVAFLLFICSPGKLQFPAEKCLICTVKFPRMHTRGRLCHVQLNLQVPYWWVFVYMNIPYHKYLEMSFTSLVSWNTTFSWNHAKWISTANYKELCTSDGWHDGLINSILSIVLFAKGRSLIDLNIMLFYISPPGSFNQNLFSFSQW